MRYYVFDKIYAGYPGVEIHRSSEPYIFIHSHDFWEIFLITDGTVDHEINGRTVKLEANDFVCIRPQDVHSFSCPRGESYKMVCATVSARKFDEFASLFCLGDDFFPSDPNADIMYRLNAIEKESLLRAFGKAEQALADESSVRRYESVLISEFFKLLVNKGEGVNLPAWISRMIAVMNSPEGMQLGIGEICAESGYGKTQCIKLFKQYMGLSPIEYFLDCKIKYVCNLLINTDFSMLEICGKIGYNSLSHFDNLFRKKMGVSPLNYRKNCLNTEKKQ